MEFVWKSKIIICTALWSFLNFCCLSQSEVKLEPFCILTCSKPLLLSFLSELLLKEMHGDQSREFWCSKDECGAVTYVCYRSNLIDFQPRLKNLTWNQIWPATKSKHQLYCNKLLKNHVISSSACLFTYSSMSATLISITTQPFQGSFDFKFNIISSKCPPGVCQTSHCFRSHLHHNLVIWWKQIPQIIGKPAHFGGISTVNSNKGN